MTIAQKLNAKARVGLVGALVMGFLAVTPGRPYAADAQAKPSDQPVAAVGKPGDKAALPAMPKLDRNHLLGPGDVIEIVVEGYPQFSRKATVFVDGTFDYQPILESVPAAGLTVKELQLRLAEGLRKELRRPVVYVNLLDVYIPPPAPVVTPKIVALGAITRKGQMEMPQPKPLRQVLEELGPTPRADLSSVRIRYADGTSRTIDASSFALKGEIKDDILIRGGEEIILVERPEVQRPDPVKFQVLGHVVKAGIVTVDGTLSLLEALDKVGGPKAGADLERVEVRPAGDPALAKFVNLEKYMDGDTSANYFCKTADVIVVKERALKILVLGEVAKQGELAIKPNDTLMDVYLQAGVNQNGDMERLELIREDKNGKAVKTTINLKDILKKKKKDDVALLPGDVLYVPHKKIKRNLLYYLGAVASPLWLMRTISPTGGL